MLFVRFDLGAYLQADPDSAHWIWHYWGSFLGDAKAWQGSLWVTEAHRAGQCSTRLGANLHYLSRLEPVAPGTVACAKQLSVMKTLRRTAEAHPHASVLGGSQCTAYAPPKVAVW